MFTEDLDAFYSLSDHAVPVVAGTATFNAIFNAEFAEVNGVEGNYPVLSCKTSDTTALTIGQTISVNSVSYKVVAKRPDNTGESAVLLESVS